MTVVVVEMEAVDFEKCQEGKTVITLLRGLGDGYNDCRITRIKKT